MILTTIQSWTQEPFLFWLSIFASKYLIFILAGMVGLLGFGKHRRKYRAYAYTTAWAAILAFITSLAIGAIVKRPRPFVLLHMAARIEPPFTEYSFPSSHSAVAFAIASGLALAHPGLGAIAFILACLIAVARVAVGVHFPIDVLSGAALGIFSSLLVHWYRLYLLPKTMRKKR